MADTSGTTTFRLDIADAIEEAYERIGKELRTGYDYRSARRSLDIMFLEWQNRGMNLWTVNNATQTLTAGTATYTLPVDVLDIVDATLRTDDGNTTSQRDIYMKRISVNTYARQTNKLQQGRPIQYWVNRDVDDITLHVWPVPDSQVTYYINYYYMKRIEDTGQPANLDLDVPVRFMPVIAAGLAYYLSMKSTDTMQLAPALKTVYEEQWELASEAAREKASLMIVPDLGYA